MSSVYVLEPPTKGKVILNTTYGPIDIELWPKEAPKAVRNFVQLCLESYYDNTIFHRIIKGFLVQGGDPTGTGSGGESIYGGPFTDEFHSRLRFNHRGLVACANAGTPHSNGSQFFISLDRCDWLDKKNTIFGKVTGDSLYNLLSLGEAEADNDDRPLDPAPKLISTEVLWNPFEDFVPRELPTKSLPSVSENENENAKKKGVKKLSLLSFGEEAEEEEKELAAVKQKIKSSHDVLNDPRLLKDGKPESDMKSETAKAVRDVLSSKKEQFGKDVKAKFSRSDDNKESGDDDDDEMSFDARMRQQIIKKKLEMGDATVKKMRKEASKPKVQEKPVREKSNPRSDEEELDEKSKASKLSMRKKGIGSEARNDRLVNADTDIQLLNNAERGRMLQKQKKRRLQGREDEALAKLERIKHLLATGSGSSQNESEGKSEEDLSNWFSNKFTPKPIEDKMARSENLNDYVVHDPLLEQGKQKFNKMIAKQRKQQREWAGKPLL